MNVQEQREHYQGILRSLQREENELYASRAQIRDALFDLDQNVRAGIPGNNK